jgi:hypothetical protein
MAFENMSKEELFHRMMELKVKDIIMLMNLLISEVGKEKTKELIKNIKWESRYIQGREAAEKLGNPQDLDSYIEEYWGNFMSSVVPWVPVEWTERTKDRAVCRCTNNCTGQTIAKLGDKDICEIGKEAYCIHDIAWAAGFNPDIKVHISKIYYDGDDCCEFVMEYKPESAV